MWAACEHPLSGSTAQVSGSSGGAFRKGRAQGPHWRGAGAACQCPVVLAPLPEESGFALVC